MTPLNYDIDNFSGRNSRGARYDIIADDAIIYHDVCEDEIDTLIERMRQKPYLYNNIEAVRIK